MLIDYDPTLTPSQAKEKIVTSFSKLLEEDEDTVMPIVSQAFCKTDAHGLYPSKEELETVSAVLVDVMATLNENKKEMAQKEFYHIIRRVEE